MIKGKQASIGDPKSNRLVALSLAAALLVAGCGGGDSNDADGALTGASSGRSANADPGDATTADQTSTADEQPDLDDEPAPTTIQDDTIDDNTAEADEGDTGTDGLNQLGELALAPLAPTARGDKGDVVEALQERLFELGMGSGTPDGSFGPRTEAAVAAFQGLVGLEQTGEANAVTMVALAGYSYDGLILNAGDDGQDVEDLQQRLADGPFDPGPVDGEYGTTTVQAVWALEKLAGLPVDGNWGPLEELAWQQLQAGELGAAERSNDTRWVEVDLSEQVFKVYEPDVPTPVLVSHVSSGSGIPWENEEYSGSSVTPLGDFHIDRRISGWRESSLNIGRLYNPLYFNGGIAFHGATSVPNYPASHGCIRVPMHIAEYLPDELPYGTAVHVLP